MSKSEQIAAAQAEIERLLADNPEEKAEAARLAVVAARKALEAKRAELAAIGSPLQIIARNGARLENPALREFVVAHNLARDERRAALEPLEQIERLRKFIENGGSNLKPFRMFNAPKLSPGEAEQNGGRRLERNKEGRLVLTRTKSGACKREPTLPTRPTVWIVEPK